MKKSDNKRTRRGEKGVILLEAIIAVGVLAIVSAATLNLMTRSVAGVRISNDHLIATYLAQDAVEYLVARKEYNKRSGLNFLNGITAGDCHIGGGDCILDTTSVSVAANNPALVNCGGTCPSLRYDASSHLYSHAAGSPTIFTRTITAGDLAGIGHEESYTVRVSWQESSGTEQVEVTVVLYDD